MKISVCYSQKSSFIISHEWTLDLSFILAFEGSHCFERHSNSLWISEYPFPKLYNLCAAITLKYIFFLLQHSETIKQVVIINLMILCSFKVLHSCSQNFPSILASQARAMYLGFYSWDNWNVQENGSQCLQQVRNKAGISGKYLTRNTGLPMLRNMK